MVTIVRTLLAAVVTGATAALVAVVPAPAAEAAGPVTSGITAWYQMDEPAGSTVMLDSSGNGNDGTVNPAGVETGGVFDGATAYNWPYRLPTEPPASPERIVQVPDDIALEPGNDDFTIELRLRFTNKFGNIAQKGQATTPGGQWKIQAPGGIPSCLFKGSAGQVATGSQTAMDDGKWHTLTCSLDSTGVKMYVDGLLRSTKLGTVGTIDNTFPMTVGGKIQCNQVTVTCDYFSGQLDYLRISKGPNAAPTASFTSDCPTLTCAFDASASSDSDGEVASYDWSFGDGTTGSGKLPTHVYAESGTYRVRLTTTDNRGATSTQVRNIIVSGVPVTSQVQHVATAVGVGNSATPSVVVPAAAQAGDLLLLIFSMSNTDRAFTTPSGVTGLTRLGTNTAKTMSTTVWTKTLAAGDPGSSVTVPLSGGLAKYTLTAAVYSGVAETSSLAFASDAGLTNATTRATPEVSGIADGSWVVSFWSDKSSSTTAWTPSAAVTTRGTGCGTGSARICSALADSNAKVPAVYGNISASIDAPSSAATMWSIVLPTADGDEPPVEEPDPSIDFVGSAATASSNAKPSVVVPAAVDPGDRLLLVMSVNATGPTFSDPAGWTRLDTVVAKTMSTTVWTKAAVSADRGSTVQVPLGAAAKATLTVAAYRGVGAATPTFSTATQLTNATARQTPAVDAPAGSWVVSHWADKSGTTSAWSTTGATARQAICAEGSGRTCSLLADSGAPVSGSYGPIAASTDAASSTATMWSVVLAP
ncbi:MAG: PKD domain-containing protein [Nocardioides sp.]|uniref:PKD domain-containing protein n=1 Tax=Nocardioides sp. TaxID=35761 RepID=UPI0039E3C85A